MVHTSACVHLDMKQAGSLESTKELLECSLNFPSASYLDENTADVRTNCFITFSTRWKFFFSRYMFADVMSVHNRDMKHARAIEFDKTNFLAML